MQEQINEEKSQNKTWLKRFGVAGFLFFFIKGMMWLIVPALITYFAW